MAVVDLLKSKAKVWMAPTGEARPDETSVDAGASWGGNWTDIGMTNAPLSLKYEASEYDFTVEQYAGPVKRVKTSEICELETVLGEVTAENIARAVGLNTTAVTTTAAGASQKGYEELNVGGSFDLREWAIGFEGTRVLADGSTQPVRVFIDQATCYFNGQLTFSAKNDEASGIPFLVKALANTSSSGRFYTWQRVTAAATS